MRRIVLIGAGSAVFTRGLVADLIADGREWTVGLVDTDPTALAVAQGLCARMVSLADAPIEIDASIDRRDLLRGSDVVVTTIAVGGRRAWERDVLIPRRFGITQPVGDTVSIGGISRALRMVPAMIDIARDVVALCPGALFVNYGNPMSVVCWAIRKATGAPVIGLCHGVPNVHEYLSAYVGALPDQVQSTAVGVNHLTWFTELVYRGQDAWPLVAHGRKVRDDVDNPFSWSLYGVYHAFPAVLDRHVTEFFPSMLREGAYFGHTLGVDTFSFEETIARGDERYAAMAAQAQGRAPIDARILRRKPGEGEKLLQVLNAVWSDSGHIFSANLPNCGAVENVDPAAVLEMPCAATKAGLIPKRQGTLSPGIAALLQRVVAVHSLTVEAATRGDRGMVVQALLTDGAMGDPGKAGALVDELLRAQRSHLPQFT